MSIYAYTGWIWYEAPLVHIAAQKADLNLLKKLKESDCELNIRNQNGNNGWFQSHFYFCIVWLISYTILHPRQKKLDLLPRSKNFHPIISPTMTWIFNKKSLSQEFDLKPKKSFIIRCTIEISIWGNKVFGGSELWTDSIQ